MMKIAEFTCNEDIGKKYCIIVRNNFTDDPMSREYLMAIEQLQDATHIDCDEFTFVGFVNTDVRNMRLGTVIILDKAENDKGNK